MKRKASSPTPEAKRRKLAKGRDKEYGRQLGASAGQGSRKASTQSVCEKDAKANASSTKRVSLKRAATSSRRSSTKKVSSTEAEGGIETSVFQSNAKKKVPKTKPITKRLRESIPDNKFMTGPISNLEWSEWKLVISRWIFLRPDKYQFKWSKIFRGFFRRNCFVGTESVPAIYEVGVKYGCYHHKMHVMYSRACAGTNKGKGLMLYILSNKFVRDEINRHVKKEFDIYIRRGISRHTDDYAKAVGAVKEAADHLKSIDYAWKKSNLRKKRYREDISEAELMTGPVKTLDWSEWYLAISKHVSVGYDCNKLQKSAILGGCYLQRNLFEKDEKKGEPSIYEVGVRYTNLKRKILVTYYHANMGVRRNKRIVPFILNNKMIHDEIKRLLNNNFDVYIRRGASNEIFHATQREHIKTAAENLNLFDFAWSPHGSRGPRKLMTD